MASRSKFFILPKGISEAEMYDEAISRLIWAITKMCEHTGLAPCNISSSLIRTLSNAMALNDHVRCLEGTLEVVRHDLALFKQGLAPFDQTDGSDTLLH